MAMTNAEKQARWRRKRDGLADRAITNKDSDDGIIWKLVDALGYERAKAIGEQLKTCPQCQGSGQWQMAAYGECSFRRDRKTGKLKSCPGKFIEKSEPFPCPTCRPAEYAVASGVELRNQGRYVEALRAAHDVMDKHAAGKTVLAWGAKSKEIQKACDAAGLRLGLQYIGSLRKMAQILSVD